MSVRHLTILSPTSSKESFVCFVHCQNFCLSFCCPPGSFNFFNISLPPFLIQTLNGPRGNSSREKDFHLRFDGPVSPRYKIILQFTGVWISTFNQSVLSSGTVKVRRLLAQFLTGQRQRLAYGLYRDSCWLGNLVFSPLRVAFSIWPSALWS